MTNQHEIVVRRHKNWATPYPEYPLHHEAFFGKQTRPIKSKGIRWLEIVFNSGRQTGCINWPFSARETGYGQIFINGIRTTAHRVICVWENGPPTTGHQAAHECGNRRCCNPSHIKWKTPKENGEDKIVHGTHMQGSQIYNAKLTDEIVISIRDEYLLGKSTMLAMASRYNVTLSTIFDVVHRKTWKHI